ncbi:hypothetical protein M440DRAFT_1404704 [Trichoderma longibrachiatum ATCC 18648]|uniref:Uncharacterized protein n=1 Tax=Trichoderma longibrachiatum ATCC 18648 TaxID=983965 RepID=A0A2T4BUL0_TRILO|nr:hypothetical protein M440DRAFT_1404704 [Trichoderma longibrachiatum ATCC 18648]
MAGLVWLSVSAGPFPFCRYHRALMGSSGWAVVRVSGYSKAPGPMLMLMLRLSVPDLPQWKNPLHVLSVAD